MYVKSDIKDVYCLMTHNEIKTIKQYIVLFCKGMTYYTLYNEVIS